MLFRSKLTLTYPDGNPVDVSDSTTLVHVKFRATGTTNVLATLSCSKPNGGADGVVVFNFPGSTLNVPAGDYEGEVTIDFSSEVQTVYDVLKFVVRAEF